MGKTNVIVDTCPDISHQTTLFDITNIDGVFYSHQHSDHVDGIHELRSMYYRNGSNSIPCFESVEALEDIARRHDFMFTDGAYSHIYPTILTAHNYKKSYYCKPQSFNDLSYISFEMNHGACMSVGFRFGGISYCVDMKEMDDKALDCVKGSKIWIVDGCGYHNANNPVHANLETLYRYNEVVGAQKVYVTSLSPLMDYQELLRELPEGFYPAHDGLSFDL
jgi:phosphoribosyl 1,2-cyclic phosphate phosphodiesterase